MKNGNNTIRLTEKQFHTLVESAVMKTIEEGRLGDFAKKVGKGVGKAALYGALGTAGLYSVGHGLDKELDKYDRTEMQAKKLQGPTDDKVYDYMKARGIENTPQNYEKAWNELNDEMQNESKLNARLSSIIREEINKVL